MKTFDHSKTKLAFLTHPVPLSKLAAVKPLAGTPRIGDLVLTEVLAPGHHSRIEDRSGRGCDIFPGDHIVGAFGNRYATDQFEGYVPKEPVNDCHLMSIGGVCGQVAAQHVSMDPPTSLRVHGAVCGPDGQPLNLRAFGLPARDRNHLRGEGPQLVLVLGSSMNSGKTTTVGTLARALRREGFCVAAAKVTGTAAGKDPRYFASCGAKPVLDFINAGYPSTYMLELDKLLGIYNTLVAELAKSNPHYIVVEIADGIFQRETRLMLECEAFRRTVDHLFFAAGDSLAIACGVRVLRDYGLPLRATSGTLTRSPLAVREAEAVTGLPCLTVDRIMAGEALGAMRLGLNGRPISPQLAAPEQAGQFRRNGEPAIARERSYASLRGAMAQQSAGAPCVN